MSQANLATGSKYPDINMDVTNIVHHWLSGSTNNGMLIKRTGSIENTSGSGLRGLTQFYSNFTQTMFRPYIEAKWDDYTFNTGSAVTESLKSYDDEINNSKVILKNNRESYHLDDRVKFRMGVKNLNPKYSSYDTIELSGTTQNYYYDEMYYRLVEEESGAEIIPFGTYSRISVDDTSSYFDFWFDVCTVNRFYEIQFKGIHNNDVKIFPETYRFQTRE